MDHYNILGLSRHATKDEIKEAFRRLALKFHPDKHSQSSKEVRDGATLRFKQVSEAYEVLINDQRRADYNRRSGSFYGGSGFSSSGYGHGRNAYGQRSSAGSGRRNSQWRTFDLDIVFRYLTTRGFLLNVAFAGILLGGAVVIQRSGDALWKINNSGAVYDWDKALRMMMMMLKPGCCFTHSLSTVLSWGETQVTIVVNSVKKHTHPPFVTTIIHMHTAHTPFTKKVLLSSPVLAVSTIQEYPAPGACALGFCIEASANVEILVGIFIFCMGSDRLGDDFVFAFVLEHTISLIRHVFATVTMDEITAQLSLMEM